MIFLLLSTDRATLPKLRFSIPGSGKKFDGLVGGCSDGNMPGPGWGGSRLIARAQQLGLFPDARDVFSLSPQ
jgi:hypothetical protein